MADIRPFCCIHPAEKYAARVAALPYDVYSRTEAAEEASKDTLSFLNIDRPETQFGPEQDMYAPEVYEKADSMLQERLESGIFVKNQEAGYELYEQTMNGRSQTGIVACASIDNYRNNVIRKHENTRAEKEADRIRHVDVCSMQTGPIFLTYRANPVISEITEQVKAQKPWFDFVSEDGIRHRGWHIGDPEQTARIRRVFDGIDRLYIADGHHRAASAVKVGMMRRQACPDYTGEEEFNYFLSVLFPDEELLIMDYNRAVRDLNGLTEEEFLARAEEVFEVEREAAVGENEDPERLRPKEKGEIKLVLGGFWYRLTIRKEFRTEDPVDGLDVSILQNAFLGPVLGIDDPKKNPRIDFIGGIRGMRELERRTQSDCAAAFAIYPTSIDELFRVADAGRLMPPKSTWFEPKLRSGLFLHEIERR